MGFGENKLKISATAMALEGYQGDQRTDVAEIIIPRRHVGGAANDVGFKQQADGTWSAIVSDYDSHSGQAASKSKYAKGTTGYDALWLKRLNQRYAYHKVKETITSQGFSIESESETEEGEILMNVNATGFGGY